MRVSHSIILNEEVEEEIFNLCSRMLACLHSLSENILKLDKNKRRRRRKTTTKRDKIRGHFLTTELFERKKILYIHQNQIQVE